MALTRCKFGRGGVNDPTCSRATGVTKYNFLSVLVPPIVKCKARRAPAWCFQIFLFPNFSMEIAMTRICRILILAALTLVVAPSFPVGSSAATLFCENGLDCPIGDFCSVRPGHKTGRCVGASVTHALFCESGKDCPIGEFCSARPGHKTGRCVGGFSAATIHPILCGDSSDCPIGRFCRTKPGHDVGQCVSQ